MSQFPRKKSFEEFLSFPQLNGESFSEVVALRDYTISHIPHPTSHVLNSICRLAQVTCLNGMWVLEFAVHFPCARVVQGYACRVGELPPSSFSELQAPLLGARN